MRLVESGLETYILIRGHFNTWAEKKMVRNSRAGGNMGTDEEKRIILNSSLVSRPIIRFSPPSFKPPYCRRA
jgi:hypothetical protein